MQPPPRVNRALFLDRDGTLNFDPGYLNDPAQLVLLPEVGRALALAKAAGFKLIVVSNQSGVERGLIKKEAIPKIHERLQELLAPSNVEIDHFEICIHRPNQECECRKPKPKLILDSSERFGIDVSRSYMVGDRRSDLEAGSQAGCRSSLLVRTGGGTLTESEIKGSFVPGFIGDSLLEVVTWVLNQGDSGTLKVFQKS